MHSTFKRLGHELEMVMCVWKANLEVGPNLLFRVLGVSRCIAQSVFEL